MSSREAERLQLQLEIAKLQEELRMLREVNAMQTEALVESNKLLQKQKPGRIAMSSDKKIYLAGLQHFKCAGDPRYCPLYRLGDGSFDCAGWECDHTERWSTSYRNAGNLACLCPMCHNRKTREERINAGEDE